MLTCPTGCIRVRICLIVCSRCLFVVLLLLLLQAYFDVCDHDGHGGLTFSEFLRFVDLCDLNPDHHISVEDDVLGGKRESRKDKGRTEAFLI